MSRWRPLEKALATVLSFCCDNSWSCSLPCDSNNNFLWEERIWFWRNGRGLLWSVCPDSLEKPMGTIFNAVFVSKQILAELNKKDVNTFDGISSRNGQNDHVGHLHLIQFDCIESLFPFLAYFSFITNSIELNCHCCDFLNPRDKSKLSCVFYFF